MSDKAKKDALVAAISAINDGVTEMLIRGAKLPSVGASIRAGHAVRIAREAMAEEPAITPTPIREDG